MKRRAFQALIVVMALAVAFSVGAKKKNRTHNKPQTTEQAPSVTQDDLSAPEETDPWAESEIYKKALAAIEANQSDSAIAYFEAEVEQNEAHHQAWGGLAYQLLLQNEFSSSTAAINNALKYCNSTNAENLSAYHWVKGQICEFTGDTIQAIAEYSTSINLDPDDYTLYRNRGSLYLETDQYDLAEADFKKIIEITPFSADGHSCLAAVYATQEKVDKAIYEYRYASKLDPNNDFAVAGLGAMLDAKGKTKEALDAFLQALSIDQSNEIANEGLAGIAQSNPALLLGKLKVKYNTDKNSALWPAVIGRIYYINQDYENALNYLKASFVNEEETSGAMAYYISACCNEIGDHTQALEYANKCVDMYPDSLLFVMNKVQRLEELGKYEAGIAILDDVIAKNPDKGLEAYRGEIYYMSRNLDKAIEDFTIALNKEDSDIFSHMFRGRSYYEKGEKEKARPDMERVLQLDTLAGKDGSVAHYAHFYLGNNTKAKELMQQVLQCDTTDKGNYYDAACLYSLMGEKKQALSLFQKSVELGYNDICHIEHDGDLDNIRNMSGFKATMKHLTDAATKKFGSPEGSLYETISADIPFVPRNNELYVKSNVNGLPMEFIFDTGAELVSMSATEYNYMLKHGYLKKEEVLGSTYFGNAEGEQMSGLYVKLRELEVAGVKFYDVRALVTSGGDDMLLGQTLFSRLGSYEIDNEHHVIHFTYNKRIEK